METRELQSWDEFEGVIKELQQFREKGEASMQEGLVASNLLFRGQPDAEMHLETTLERAIGPDQTLKSYQVLIEKGKNRIETFTTKHQVLPKDFRVFSEWLNSTDVSNRGNLPDLKYMVYLRHYGFPSPLLDWSKSPYVAAFFAFREYRSKAKSVAVFAYLESFGVKGFRGAEPFITSIGDDIPLEPRHFLQQSQYTICTKGEGINSTYCSHEKVVGNQTTGKRMHGEIQDVVWKISIPTSERGKALKNLEMFNINAYSLYPSEESLLETVFLRDHFIQI